VDLRRGVLRVPAGAGGREEPCEIPLSAPLLDLLEARLAGQRRGGAPLFPLKGGAVVRQSSLGDLQGRALRHAHMALACEAGVPLPQLRRLMDLHPASNPQPANDVHARDYQAMASGFILETLGLRWTLGQWPPQRSDLAGLQAAE
jgi:hypothetical protein